MSLKHGIDDDLSSVDDQSVSTQLPKPKKGRPKKPISSIQQQSHAFTPDPVQVPSQTDFTFDFPMRQPIGEPTPTTNPTDRQPHRVISANVLLNKKDLRMALANECLKEYLPFLDIEVRAQVLNVFDRNNFGYNLIDIFAEKWISDNCDQ